jgi:hypothetical protein
LNAGLVMVIVDMDAFRLRDVCLFRGFLLQLLCCKYP